MIELENASEHWRGDGHIEAREKCPLVDLIHLSQALYRKYTRDGVRRPLLDSPHQRTTTERWQTLENHTAAQWSWRCGAIVDRGLPELGRRLIRVDFNSAPFRGAHWKLTLGATTGYFSDGFSLGVVGMAMIAANAQLALSPYWEGMLGAGSLAGLFLGAILSGPLIDRVGRRPIYCYNMIAFSALSAIQFLVASREQLLILRMVLGVLLGSDYVVCKTLLVEFMPSAHRGRVLSSMGISWAVGYALGYLVGFLVQGQGPDAWRWILASSALPALVTIPLRWNTSESPLWLALNGRMIEAQVIAEKLLGKGCDLSAWWPKAQSAPKWRVLFSVNHRRITLLAISMYTCLVVPYFAVSTFIPLVMAALHVQGSVQAGLIYIACLLAGSILGFLVVDRFSRRQFVIGSFLVTSAALAVAAISAFQSSLLVVISFGKFSCVLSAAQAQVFVYLPELFPTVLRGSGLGLAVAASRVAVAIGTFLMPVCVARFGVRPALYICIATLIAGAVVAYAWAPETLNMRLNEQGGGR